jgi:hypothetical protein
MKNKKFTKEYLELRKQIHLALINDVNVWENFTDELSVIFQNEFYAYGYAFPEMEYVCIQAAEQFTNKLRIAKITKKKSKC